MSTNFTYNDEIYHSKGPWKKHKYIQKIGNTYFYNKRDRTKKHNYVKKIGNTYFYNRRGGTTSAPQYYNERRSEVGNNEERVDRDIYSEMNVNDLFSSDSFKESSAYNHGVTYVNNHHTHYIGRIEQTYRAGKSVVDNIINRLNRLKKPKQKSRKRP